jgi:hypothetical protein
VRRRRKKTKRRKNKEEEWKERGNDEGMVIVYIFSSGRWG